jgi:photosystem II stability/assembly factor-like uncharacterized protein
MPLRALRFLLSTFLFSALLTACGGSGSSAPPPVGGITVTPGNGQVTITWTQTAGVEYWLMYAPTANPIDIKNPPGGHVWLTAITSPYVLTGLTNGVTYSFAMNARTGSGPGGAQTPSVSATPRAAGTTGLWTAGTVLAGDLRSLTTDGTHYVSVGTQGAIYTSTDGLNWSIVSDATTGTNDLNSVLYFNSTVGYVVSDAANHIYYGTDLTALTLAQTGTSNINAFASDGTNLVAVGNSGTILRSTNGSTWTAASSVPAAANLHSVVYSSGIWVAVGDAGAIYVSTDSGANWTIPGGSYATVTSNLRGIAANGTAFVAVGDSGTVVTSADGSSWTSQTLSGSVNLYAVNASSAQYVIVGAAGSAYVSTDGSTWTAQTTNLSGDLLALIGSPTEYFVVGTSGTNAISK